ncbi:MAG: YncE family protein [Flexilinea sp.]
MNYTSYPKSIIFFTLGIICLSACVPGTLATTSIALTTHIPSFTSLSPTPSLLSTLETPEVIAEPGKILQGWAPGNLGLAISNDGKTAYVSFSLDDSLLVVDLVKLTISDSVDVSAAGIQVNSDAVLLSKNGEKLYVSNSGAENVMVVDTISKRIVKVLPICPYFSVALTASPDGENIYIPSSDGALYIVNTADDSYQKIQISGILFGPIALSLKNPNLLYTVGTLTQNQGVFQSSFFAINLANKTVERSISMPNEVIQYPVTPRRLVINADETMAYFGWFKGGTDEGIGNMVAFDLDNFQVLTSVPAEYGVTDFAMSESAGKIFVTGLWSGGSSPGNLPILEWDTSSNSFIHNIPLSESSDQRAIAIDPANSDFLYETDGDFNFLRKIQISTGKEVGIVRFANKGAFRPRVIIRGGNTGYIFGSSQSIYKLDLESGQLVGKISVPVSFGKGWGFYKDKLYVCAGKDIIALNTSDGSIVQKYPVGWNFNPHIFTFFGDRMAAIDYETGMIAKQLVIFNADTMTLLKTIPLPNQPVGDKVVASPDSSKLYIVSGPIFGGTTSITIISGTALEVLNTINIPPDDQRFGASSFLEGEFDEENRILYILGFESVYKIDMDTDQLIGTLDLVDIFNLWGRRGWTPTGLAGISLSPSKDKLFIVSGDAHTLYTYDLANASWSTRFTNLIGYFITDGVPSPDRHYLYTTNPGLDSVTMADLTSGDVVKAISLP